MFAYVKLHKYNRKEIEKLGIISYVEKAQMLVKLNLFMCMDYTCDYI